MRDPGPCVTLHHPIPPSLVQRGRSAGTARHQQLSPGTPRTFRSTSQLGGRPNQRVSSRSGRSRRGYLFRSAVGSRAGRASSHTPTDRGNHHTHTHARARAQRARARRRAPPAQVPPPPTHPSRQTHQAMHSPFVLARGLAAAAALLFGRSVQARTNFSLDVGRHTAVADRDRRQRGALRPSRGDGDGEHERRRRGRDPDPCCFPAGDAASPPAFRATAPRPAYLVGDALEPARRRGGVTTSASGNSALGRAVVPKSCVSSRSTGLWHSSDCTRRIPISSNSGSSSTSHQWPTLRALTGPQAKKILAVRGQ